MDALAHDWATGWGAVLVVYALVVLALSLGTLHAIRRTRRDRCRVHRWVGTDVPHTYRCTRCGAQTGGHP